MKKGLLITGLGVLAVAVGLVVVVIVRGSSPTVVARPVELIITGAEGQRFQGSYAADGITNTLSAVVPATIRLRAREVTYGFAPADDREEFRVALDVEGGHRTSFVSYKGKSVKGGWRYWGTGESAW